jgi:hypothetical protein
VGQRRLRNSLDSLQRREVLGDDQAVAALALDGFLRLPEPLGIAPHDAHIHSRGSELPSDLGTDSRRAPGHEGSPSLE